jgi:hypothetical protein
MSILVYAIHILSALIAFLLSIAYFMEFDYIRPRDPPSEPTTLDESEWETYSGLAIRPQYSGKITSGCSFNMESQGFQVYHWHCNLTSIDLVPNFGYCFLSFIFLNGLFGLLLMIVQILTLFLKTLKCLDNGIFYGVIYILISIPALGVSLDLGITAGALGLLMGFFEIISNFIPAIQSQVRGD